MGVNSGIQELMSFVMNLKLDINYWPSTLHNQMVTLIDMARSMLSDYIVSHSFWAEAINTACYYN